MTLILPPARGSAWRTARDLLLAAVAALVALLASTTPASAQHAGLRTLVVPGAEPVTVALFYPTPAVARTLPMGPLADPGDAGRPNGSRAAQGPGPHLARYGRP